MAAAAGGTKSNQSSTQAKVRFDADSHIVATKATLARKSYRSQLVQGDSPDYKLLIFEHCEGDQVASRDS